MKSELRDIAQQEGDLREKYGAAMWENSLGRREFRYPGGLSYLHAMAVEKRKMLGLSEDFLRVTFIN